MSKDVYLDIEKVKSSKGFFVVKCEKSTISILKGFALEEFQIIVKKNWPLSCSRFKSEPQFKFYNF